ncbi:MAG TPA: CapA family protein, partial [Acidimicrobiales bacterium]
MPACVRQPERSRRGFVRFTTLAFALAVTGCGDGSLLRGVGVTAPTSVPTSTVADGPGTTIPVTTVGTTTTQPRPPRQVTLLFTGDTIPHDAVIAAGRQHGAAAGVAYDFAPMWSRLAPRVSSADLAVCHLETTL